MNTKLYHDARKANGRPAPVKFAINRKGSTAYIPLGVKVTAEQWDKRVERVINHPNADAMNISLYVSKVEYEKKLLALEMSGKLVGLSAIEARDLLTKEEKQEMFADAYAEFTKKKSGRTLEIYQATLQRISSFCRVERLELDDITPRWLEDFDKFLSTTSPSKNARNIHFRNIRAIMNYAITENMTTNYPFRKFKIQNTATKKRSLDADSLAEIFTMNVSEFDKKAQTALKLMFYLRGINIVDLCDIEIYEGRVEYRRRKTKKDYSIKLEPEAIRCIEELKGSSHVIYALDHYSNYKHFATYINDACARMSASLGLPRFTTYWIRHSWATIAHRIGIPKDTISLGLGHSFGCRITDVYIDYDSELVDEANRKIIDYMNEKCRHTNVQRQRN